MSEPIPYDYAEKGRRDYAEGIKNDRLYGGTGAHHAEYRRGWQEARRAANPAFLVIDDPLKPGEPTAEQRKAAVEWMNKTQAQQNTRPAEERATILHTPVTIAPPPFPFTSPSPESPRTTAEQYLERTEGKKSPQGREATARQQPPPTPKPQPVERKPSPPPAPAKPSEPKVREGDSGQFSFF